MFMAELKNPVPRVANGMDLHNEDGALLVVSDFLSILNCLAIQCHPQCWSVRAFEHRKIATISAKKFVSMLKSIGGTKMFKR